MATATHEKTLTLSELKAEQAKELARHLNQVLSNVSVIYQVSRVGHWFVKGSNFYSLHEELESIYSFYNEFGDQVAERIIGLRQKPLATFSAYLKNADVEERASFKDNADIMQFLLHNMHKVVASVKTALEYSEKIDDVATTTILEDSIKGQAEFAWKIESYLGRGNE